MPFPSLMPVNVPDPLGGSDIIAALNSKRAAANQTAERARIDKREKTAADAANLQRDFENSRQMAAMGAVPTQTYGGDAPVDPRMPSSLRMPEDNPQAPAQGQGQRITDPSGKTWYVPTEAEKSASAGKTFIPSDGFFAQTLIQAGLWDGKRPITSDDAIHLTEALDRAQPKDEPFHVDLSGKFLDGQGNPAPVLVGDKTGKVRMLDLRGPQSAFQRQLESAIPPGTILPTAGSPQEGPFSFDPQGGKPEKAPKNLHIDTRTNNAGDVTTRGFDPETGELKFTRTDKGIGPKRRDTSAGTGEKPPSGAQFRMVAAAKAKALKEANDAYTKAVASKDGIDVSEEDKHNALIELRKKHVQIQNDYEEGVTGLTGNDVPHQDWADRALEEAQRGAAQASPDFIGPRTSAAGPGRGAAKPAQQTAAKPAAAQPAQPAAAAAAQPGRVPKEDDTIVNPTTGARMKFKGGKWQPITQ
jgi:hypothetical protein